MLPARFKQSQRLFHRVRHHNRAERAIEATYDYVDEQGRLLFQVVRYEGKSFRQRRPDESGGWNWKLGNVRRVLYHLDRLTKDDGTATVYVVEGEKDVDRLWRHGLVATCNPCGAQGWWAVSDDARKALADRNIVIIADRDGSGVGQKHAHEIEASLRGVARSVRVVVAPPPCKDASDLFNLRSGKDTASILAELIDLDEYEASLSKTI